MTPLRPAVVGEDFTVASTGGEMVVRGAGSGRPVLLVHSINAAASAAEMAPLHAWAAERFQVFTPDLPGFGRSERRRQRYTPRLYVDSVRSLAAAISERTGLPPLTLALSTSAEFVARAASEAPEAFRGLAFITPTGFDRRSARASGAAGETREIRVVSSLLSRSAIGGRAFRLLTRPSVIRYFLQRTFGSKEIDEDLWAYCCESVSQPGAEYAPLSFLSGGLFSKDARSVYESLHGPVLLAHGTRGDFTDFSGADWAREDCRWTVVPFPTGAIPWFETLDDFTEVFERFAARSEA